MVRKASKLPEQGQLVIGTIKKVNPFSVFVTLDEYGEAEGMIHISEVAGKWVRDIREFAQEGKTIVALVMRTDPQTRHIYLSLKRVKKDDAERKIKEFKREQKAEKLLELVGKELNMNLDQAYEEIGFQLQESFGEMFKAFQTALQNEELLLRKGIPEKFIKAIKSVAKQHMEIKEITVKGILELACWAPEGISIIKKILMDIEKEGIEVKYISAPKYSISLKTRMAKKAEKMLQEIANTAIQKIKVEGGEGSFEVS